MGKRSTIFFAVLLTMSVSGLIFDIYLSYKENEKKDNNINVLQNSLSKEREEKTSCVYFKDSLQREVNQLSIYKSLTKSMVFRDEAVKLLPHKVGDIVYTKNDSVKGVIEDVIIGGSKYNFYIKYKVILKDNTVREVVPEVIY